MPSTFTGVPGYTPTPEAKFALTFLFELPVNT